MHKRISATELAELGVCETRIHLSLHGAEQIKLTAPRREYPQLIKGISLEEAAELGRNRHKDRALMIIEDKMAVVPEPKNLIQRFFGRLRERRVAKKAETIHE